MIHLACVVDDLERACRVCSGVTGAISVPLDQQLACVGRQCRSLAPPADPQSLVGHDRLVAGLMQACGSVAPFRYGTVLADPDAMRAELASRLGEFYDLLDRLRGRVELALRAAPVTSSPHRATADAPITERPGRAYLRSLGPASGPESLVQLHRSLAASAVAAVARPDIHGGIKASYLVEGREAASFCRRLDRAVADTGGIASVSLTGPWPPYTFAAMFDPAGPSGPARSAGPARPIGSAAHQVGGGHA